MNGTLTWQQTPGTYASYTINGASTLTFSPGSVISCDNSAGGSVTVGGINAPYAGTITKSGAATLSFNNANGAVTKFIFKQGTANFASANRFGAANAAADFLTFEGGVMSPNTTTAWTMGRSITINAGGGTISSSSATITITQDKPITWAANATFRVITSPLILQSTASTGTGTLYLSTATTCSAASVIPSTVHVTCAGSLTMTAGNQSIRSLSSSGSVTLGTRTLTLNNTSSQTYSGAISGTGSLIKNGTSPQILSGANTYTGTTTINTGILAFAGSSTCTGVTTVNTNATLRLDAAGALSSSPIVLANGGTLNLAESGPTIAALSGAGNVISNAGQVLTVSGDMNTGSVFNQYSCFSGTLTNGGLSKEGTHAMALRGSNTFDGVLTSANGTLSVGAGPNRLPPTVALVLNSPGLFQLDANSQTVSNLNGNGSLNLGGGTLTVTDPNNSAFSGVIQNSELPGSSTALGHGLRGYYYDNIDLTSLKAVRDDATINFPDFTITNNVTALPDAGITNANFSVRWLGQLLTTAAGTYIFTTTCDDGRRLWINGQLVVDSWISGSNTRTGTNVLAANTRYDIVMEFFNGTGAASAKLLWTPPGDTTSTIIPTDYLFLPGPGALVMGGTGSLTLAGANTYSGDTIVAAGTLSAGGDSALGNGNVIVSNAAILTLSGGITNGYISPSANLILNGGSPVVNLSFSGTNNIHAISFDGGVTFGPAGTYGPTGTGVAHESARLSGSGFLEVAAIPSTNVLTASPSPTVYGSSVNLTSTVSPAGVTGTITFYDGANWLGSAPLNGSGVATFSVNNLLVTTSPHAITAMYSGDATHAPSTSGAVSQSTTVATLTPNVVVANKIDDGTTNATISSSSTTFTGILSSDTNYVNISGTYVATFLDKNVGTGKTVNITGMTLGGSLASNYIMPTTSASVTADITNKVLTISGITATNRVYDGTINAGFTGTSNLVGVISPDVVTLGGAPVLTFTNKAVGTNKAVTVTGYTLGGADAGNYILVQTNLSANITARGLTITGLTANNKIFDGTTNATLSGTAALSGVISPDDVTLGGTPVAFFSNKTNGVAKPVTVTGYTISGLDSTNYTLAQPAGLTANITADATLCAVVSSVNPSGLTSNVTFTATITAVTPTTDAPTGNVSFLTNGVTMAVVNLVSNAPGVASVAASTALLPAGAHTVSAQYLGDGNFSASNNSLTQTVQSASCSQTNKVLSIVDNSDGTITLTFIGSLQAQYYVVTHTNVVAAMSSWTPVVGSTNTVTNASGLWTLKVTNTVPSRFYRSITTSGVCP